MDININITNVAVSQDTEIPLWIKDLISIVLTYVDNRSTHLTNADQKSLDEMVNILNNTNSKIDSVM